MDEKKLKIFTFLEQNFRLSRIEIEIYLLILQNKNVPLVLSKIAYHLGVSRTQVRACLDKLLAHNLIRKEFFNQHKFYAANDPLIIQRQLEIKKFNARMSKLSFTNFIKEYKRIPAHTFEIKEGVTNIRKTYNQILKSQNIYAYFNIFDISSFFPENKEKFAYYHRRNPQMLISEILIDCEKARESVEKCHPGRFFAKYTKLNFRNLDLLLFDGQVAMVDVSTEPKVTVIKEKLVYWSFVNNFKLLWNIV